LRETIATQRYADLASEVQQKYLQSLDEKLGGFLLNLKQRGDPFYTKFLNPYGDKTYCKFKVSSPNYGNLSGVYCFTLDYDVVYVGRSHDPFEKRLNQGYGNISPKNCYRDGQSTNCHINSLIAKSQDQVAFHVCPVANDADIDPLERQLIQMLHPHWNTILNS